MRKTSLFTLAALSLLLNTGCKTNDSESAGKSGSCDTNAIVKNYLEKNGLVDIDLADSFSSNEIMVNDAAFVAAVFKKARTEYIAKSTDPTKWSDMAKWVNNYQASVSGNASSFLITKTQLALIPGDPEYYQVFLAREGKKPTDSLHIVIRGIKEDAATQTTTVKYIRADIDGDGTIDDLALQHCLPCPPCATDNGYKVDYVY